jgi:hypothetical protein
MRKKEAKKNGTQNLQSFGTSVYIYVKSFIEIAIFSGWFLPFRFGHTHAKNQKFIATTLHKRPASPSIMCNYREHTAGEVKPREKLQATTIRGKRVVNWRYQSVIN